MPRNPHATDLTRRDFIRSATTAAAAAALTACRAPAAHSAGDDAIRVGLIGCGGRGTGAAENCLLSAPNVRLVALADLFPDRLKACRQELTDPERKGGPLAGIGVDDEHCFIGFDAYKKLLATDVDLVILATPPGFRPIHFAAAIEAGKHVFMEKPVAVDPVGVRKVIAAGRKAKEKRLAVVAGTQRRHQKPYLETIQRIHDGAIGDVVAGCCYWNGGELWLRERKPGMSDMEWQCRNWYYFDWLCGDHIVEQHIHNLDVINWILRAHPLSCVGIGGRQVRTAPEFGHIFDHFCIDYEYPNGVHVMSMCRQQNGTTGNVSEFVVGTKGMSDPAEALLNLQGAVTWKSKSAKGSEPYVQEHRDLIQSIRGGTPLNEAEQVAESTLTAIMGRIAAYTGLRMKWDEVYASDLDLSPAKYEWGPHDVHDAAIPGKTTKKPFGIQA